MIYINGVAVVGDMFKAVYDANDNSRIEKDALGITLNKLLKGAGVGSDPTEINVPAAPTLVRKTANESVANSTTLQSDDHLFFAVGANEVWAFYEYLIYSADTEYRFKYGFAVPSGGVLYWNEVRDIGHLSAPGYDVEALTPYTTDSIGAQGAGEDVKKVIIVWGVYVGGASAGNVQFQWSQHNSGAVATKVHANSHIIAHKLS